MPDKTSPSGGARLGPTGPENRSLADADALRQPRSAHQRVCRRRLTPSPADWYVHRNHFAPALSRGRAAVTRRAVSPAPHWPTLGAARARHRAAVPQPALHTCSPPSLCDSDTCPALSPGVDDDSDGAFTIDPESGTISTTRVLDHEVRQARRVTAGPHWSGFDGPLVRLWPAVSHRESPH